MILSTVCFQSVYTMSSFPPETRIDCIQQARISESSVTVKGETAYIIFPMDLFKRYIPDEIYDAAIERTIERAQYERIINDLIRIIHEAEERDRRSNPYIFQKYNIKVTTEANPSQYEMDSR